MSLYFGYFVSDKGGRISKSIMMGRTIEYYITMPESRPLRITIVYGGERDIDRATTPVWGTLCH